MSANPNQESFTRKRSRKDRYLEEQQTRADYLEVGEENEATFEKLLHELDEVIDKYFPEEKKDFVKPDFERIKLSYFQAMGHFSREAHHTDESNFNVEFRSFKAVSAIRYIDDFIDNGLWPHIYEYDKEILIPRFQEFLRKALQVVRKYDPSMPNEIVILPTLELHLALYPSQEEFDANFERLVTQKSFDLEYVNRWINGFTVLDTDTTRYLLGAVRDYSRDFSDEAIKSDTDFNLYAHIKKYGLNPDKFKRFIYNQLLKINPDLPEYDSASSFNSFVEKYEWPSELINDRDACVKILKSLS